MRRGVELQTWMLQRGYKYDSQLDPYTNLTRYKHQKTGHYIYVVGIKTAKILRPISNEELSKI